MQGKQTARQPPVVRIEVATPPGQHGNERAHCGTGFLVAPAAVLTCKHVVDRNSIRDYFVRFGDEDDARLVRRVVEADRDDIALLEIERGAETETTRGSRQDEAIRLARTIRCKDVDRLHLLRDLAAWGYPLDGRELHRAPNLRPLSSGSYVVHPGESEEDGTLAKMQLRGGLPKGMSGSPAVVSWQGSWVCFGLLYLGGEQAPHSSLIGADRLLEFLQGERVVVHTVDGSDVLRRLAERRSFRRRRTAALIGSVVLAALIAVVSLWPQTEDAPVAADTQPGALPAVVPRTERPDLPVRESIRTTESAIMIVYRIDPTARDASLDTITEQYLDADTAEAFDRAGIPAEKRAKLTMNRKHNADIDGEADLVAYEYPIR